MFLKQMKIVGFKSFVEPTSLFFRSDRVAIVGPNGCGKSNVIDAIRWVMGESSPKYLRGDMMSDVIFNGSVQRKPLGMAQVEIILDNRENYLQGAYVVKGDVALRREINRDGDSSYYINGQRVRRKDLTDLWLGTGAGARGYAIIGQNMVNHLVEANPEVLRGYLEEAAGVSKYKERRKETHERLKQTAENLLRIEDIISDLKIQLERLSHEAEDANLFHHLRQQLRQQQEYLGLAKARHLYLKNHDLEQQYQTQVEMELKIKQECEQKQTDLNHLEMQWQTIQGDIQTQEQALFKRRLACEQEQKNYLQRLQEQERYQLELKQCAEESQSLETQIQQEQDIAAKQSLRIATLSHEIHERQVHIQELKQQEQDFKHALKECSQQKNQVQQQVHQQKTKIQVLKAKYEQSQMSVMKVQEQMSHWRHVLNQQDCSHLEKKVSAVLEQIKPQEHDLQRAQDALALLQQELQRLFFAYNDAKRLDTEQYAQVEEKKRCAIVAEASYQGLLANIDTKHDGRLKVESNLGLNNLVQWLQAWQIPSEWQHVVDWLWQAFLPHAITDDLKTLPQHTGFYALLKPYTMKEKPHSLTSLLELMQITSCPTSYLSWEEIYVVAENNEAWNCRHWLQPYQSIITPQGLWLGQDWTYVIPHENTHAQGLASRLNAYKAAQREWQETQDAFSKIHADFLHLERDYLSLKQQTETQQKDYENQVMLLNTLKQQYQHDNQQLQFLVQERQRQQYELNRAEQHYAELVANHHEWLDEIQDAEQEIKQAQDIEQEFSMKSSKIYAQVSTIEQDLKIKMSDFDLHHQELTKIKVEHDFYVQNFPKLLSKRPQLQDKIRHLQHHLDVYPLEAHWSDAYFASEFQYFISEQQDLEKRKEDFKQQTVNRQDIVASLEKLKKQHLHALEKKWRISSEKDQMLQEIEALKQELNQDFSPQLWQNLAKEYEPAHYKEKIAGLEIQLQALGDVNLLAIGLFAQEKKRYEDVLLQEQDLQTAIKELEYAIKTLDMDMQTRLHETLIAINEQLKVIFPQLFGGGEAKFVASCDNLLEATVAVQVQLPGKKQHRIQLLSGGEKALTAVALLFAIFALNPAPFCLLDEVDAALDDANVLRLAALIKNMSQTVQFIIITHNPLSMDVAEELIGVTMQEPGVSRVVAVNMAMALAMVNKE